MEIFACSVECNEMSRIKMQLTRIDADGEVLVWAIQWIDLRKLQGLLTTGERQDSRQALRESARVSCF